MRRSSRERASPSSSASLSADALASEPKRFHRFEGGKHGDLWKRGLWDVVQATLKDWDIIAR